MRKIKPLRSESQSSTAVFFKNRKVGVALALLLFDAVLTALIIAYVPYTKIDWDAYMSQVTGFLEGEKDYSQLKGDTGPLVYPAGFLYVYSAIQYVTGGEVIAAQILFGVLYIVNLAIILYIYVKADVWCCFYKDECFALCSSIAPPYVKGNGSPWGDICFSWCCVSTVNLSADSVGPSIFTFTSCCIYIKGLQSWACLHPFLFLLTADGASRFEGGLLRFLRVRVFSFAAIKNSSLKKIKEEHILTTMFVGNFIGVLFARSLHYQFYSWYFFSIPHLLWTTRFPSFVRLLLFIGVELCWNIYPSTAYSSALLLCLHLIILWGLWSAPPEYPYREEKASTQEKDK
ncbi:Dol-P-Man:Man(5)GlcNAc(2)-PP-Dol alpha-1,3-mannosyltransferase [Linum perenne]